MNYLGIDFGEKKIGLSLSAGEIARPFLVLRVKSPELGIAEIKEICEEEIDFVIIDLEKLTNMTLNVENGENYNEFHPAVLRQITNIVKTCRRHDTETSVIGKQIYEPEFIELLIKNGIDSIICGVEDVNETKNKIAKSERKLILNKVREEYHSKQL